MIATALSALVVRLIIKGYKMSRKEKIYSALFAISIIPALFGMFATFLGFCGFMAGRCDATMFLCGVASLLLPIILDKREKMAMLERYSHA